MKKTIFILLATVLLIFTSCRKDSDSTNDNTALVGTWQPTSVKVVGTATVNGQQVPVNGTNQVPECEKKSRIVFKADLSGSNTMWSQNSSGTCVQDGTSNFTYTYNAGTKLLTVKESSGASESLMLTSLTNTEMTFDQKVTNENINGYIFTGTITAIYTKVN